MKPKNNEINYEQLVEAALMGVVREVLRQVAKHGLVGDSHYYVNFSTEQAGVSMPNFLRERFPHEMTIVLQHQFWDLTVRETDFSVTLSFGGEPYVLTIPYAAMISFADPSREFGLRFSLQTEISAALSDAAARALESLTAPKGSDGAKNGTAKAGEGATILTLPFGEKSARKRSPTKSDSPAPSSPPPIAAPPKSDGPSGMPGGTPGGSKPPSNEGNVVAFPGKNRKK
ncbi:MAG: ClpXP protease specificity-enhancing factor SspB [Candidatus Symbiobacter sp.]|nr:ClpXP protease specificity-enhancing factor SspB [Candidatus Symbiobacter sp.]